MDEQSQAKLDQLLAIEPAALTEADKEFLRARSSYIPAHLQEIYTGEKTEVQADTQVEEPSIESASEFEPEKPKKAKKAK